MLVLTRRKNESIVIAPFGAGGMGKVTVVEIRGDKVRLGIEAPREWEVHRQEVWEQIHKPEMKAPHPASPPQSPSEPPT